MWRRPSTRVRRARMAMLLATQLGTLATLPILPGPPQLPTLPTSSGPSSATAPARPSRSPPSKCSGVSAPGVVGYAQSTFPCDFPDPMVLRTGGAWYAYGSSTGWEPGNAAFPILRSTDLRHWYSVGNALSPPPAWSAGDLWSPDVIRWHGRYLLFYNAMRRSNELHCIAVATAANPQGPFRPRRIIACRGKHVRGFIDPAALLAPDRQLYLFFSVDFPRHSIRALRLSPSGLRAAGPIHRALSVSPRWGNLNSPTVEGPWPVFRNGRYLLFYSAGSWSSDYRMSYAVAKSPLGPYVDSAPVAILAGQPELLAPGGGSTFTGPGGHNWLAFAAWTGTPAYRLGSQRTLRIAPVSWRDHGHPEVLLGG